MTSRLLPLSAVKQKVKKKKKKKYCSVTSEADGKEYHLYTIFMKWGLSRAVAETAVPGRAIQPCVMNKIVIGVVPIY